ncbi:glycosyltransferase family 2 protein [Erwinia aphidicola]|uniref:Glycosyltransferase family 2 protein n=1 Tax=Erwinia aphidicola TaxID=68334 RepID=A0ABU8DIA5_ERWAP
MNKLKNEKFVAVLLSTYNGQEFLKEQLDSLISQNNNNFKVFIRDDGSNDKTLNICRDYQERYDDKFLVLDDDLGNLGVTRSFEKLMQTVNSELYMFCDQDDIWLPNKINSAISHYNDFANKYSKERPVMFYTDLIPFKDSNTIISNSYLKLINADTNPELDDLIFSVPTWGCTCIFNAAMKDKALPMPRYIRYHDGWLCLLAYLSNSLIYIDECDIYYRLHDKNSSNASKTVNKHSIKNFYHRIKMALLGDEKGQDILKRKINQSVLALEKTSTQKGSDFYKAMTGNVYSRILFFVWSKTLAKRSILFSPNLLKAVVDYKKKDD